MINIKMKLIKHVRLVYHVPDVLDPIQMTVQNAQAPCNLNLNNCIFYNDIKISNLTPDNKCETNCPIKYYAF